MNSKSLTISIKFFVVASLLVFFSASAFAQKKLKQPRHTRTQLSGTLIHKEWTKSTQSYCAHQSDYFVIRLDNDKEIVLQGHAKNVKGKKMMIFAGKKVRLDGYLKTKVIEPNGNPMAQRPVSTNPVTGERSESFSCKIFVVQNIRVE
ncbi:hypothetical protein BKI52_16860 [marine bacterium AO1-C]|nr:hypothetical protein BKI52_16860 [marine bacterium AO1-C]